MRHLQKRCTLRLTSVGSSLVQNTRAAGQAMGIVWILTHMAPLVEHGKLWIPQDLMREAGLKANIVAKRQTNQALTDTVATMCLIAERHLNSARNEKAGKQAAQILSQSAIVDAWLQQLRSSNYDIFAPTNEHPPRVRCQLKLLKHSLRGQY
mmetsp:Transcript_13074/g.30876  ORF Transcript_13074/g.30876 Transcript_13074/m.30876 type:complete len:152 (+) Transcript_13074:479-934(+)